MSGIRGEPVEVWLRDGKPARFVWRGRMFTVIFVLDRRIAPGQGPANTDNDKRGGRECWLVEATPLRAVPPATYELCRDVAADRWMLSRS
jgi:hypothetical protein